MKDNKQKNNTKETQTAQTDTTTATMATQTENNRAIDDLQEIWVSRVNPDVCLQEERT